MRVAVFGATGGIGYSTVLEAQKAGHAVRALVRNPRKLPFPDGVEVVVGDATDPATVRQALAGCSALFYCLNVSFAADWSGQVRKFLGPSLDACRAGGIRLVFPGNVWVFGRGRPGELVDESRLKVPCSEKGRVRAELEQRLADAQVRYTILRLPEFYGPNVTTFTGPAFQSAVRGKTIYWPAPLDVPVEFVYMPDAAVAMVEVGVAHDCDGQTFHLPGPGPITARQFLAEVVREAGSRSRVRRVPTVVIRAGGLVSTVLREVADILHLWTDPILLDGSKYRRQFGRIPATPYPEAIRQTLAWFAAHPEVKTGWQKT